HRTGGVRRYRWYASEQQRGEGHKAATARHRIQGAADESRKKQKNSCLKVQTVGVPELRGNVSQVRSLEGFLIGKKFPRMLPNWASLFLPGHRQSVARRLIYRSGKAYHETKLHTAVVPEMPPAVISCGGCWNRRGLPNTAVIQ